MNMEPEKSLSYFFTKLAAGSVMLTPEETHILQDAVGCVTELYSEEELQSKTAEAVIMDAAKVCQYYFDICK